MNNVGTFSRSIVGFIKTKLGIDELTMGRKQFIINGVIVAILGILFDTFSWREYSPYLFIQLALLVVAGFIYIPSLIRRSRDAGWGEVWWVGLIPLINFVYFFILVIKPSKTMNNINNTFNQTDEKTVNKSENKSSQQFKKTDWILFWIGVILIIVGIPSLLDSLASVSAGATSSGPNIDLLVAAIYTTIGLGLFISKKRKLKKLSDEATYKKTVKIAYITIGVFFALIMFSVWTLFSL